MTGSLNDSSLFVKMVTSYSVPGCRPVKVALRSSVGRRLMSKESGGGGVEAPKPMLE